MCPAPTSTTSTEDAVKKHTAVRFGRISYVHIILCSTNVNTYCTCISHANHLSHATPIFAMRCLSAMCVLSKTNEKQVCWDIHEKSPLTQDVRWMCEQNGYDSIEFSLFISAHSCCMSMTKKPLRVCERICFSLNKHFSHRQTGEILCLHFSHTYNSHSQSICSNTATETALAISWCSVPASPRFIRYADPTNSLFSKLHCCVVIAVVVGYVLVVIASS